MEARFCVEFQRIPLKFQAKYLTHTLKDIIVIQLLESRAHARFLNAPCNIKIIISWRRNVSIKIYFKRTTIPALWFTVQVMRVHFIFFDDECQWCQMYVTWSSAHAHSALIFVSVGHLVYVRSATSWVVSCLTEVWSEACVIFMEVFEDFICSTSQGSIFSRTKLFTLRLAINGTFMIQSVRFWHFPCTCYVYMYAYA